MIEAFCEIEATQGPDVDCDVALLWSGGLLLYPSFSQSSDSEVEAFCALVAPPRPLDADEALVWSGDTVHDYRENDEVISLIR